MKFKNKIVFFIVVFSLLILCLSFSVSASTWLSIDDSEFVESAETERVGYGLHYLSNNKSNDGTFNSSLDEYVGIIYDLNGAELVGFINIEWWHNYLKSENVTDSDSFMSAVYKTVDYGYFSQDFIVIIEAYADLFYNSYKLYTENTAANQYITGYTNGYAVGYDEGVGDFKESDEYQSALKEQYDVGLKQGQDGNVLSSLLSALVPVLMLCFVLIVILIIIKNTRRKRF